MTASANNHDWAILYVDDEQQALKYFARAVGQVAEILTADNIDDAWQILKERGNDIAILITDQRMPGGNGVELLRKARTGYPQIVRLLTTAYSDLGEAIDAVNDGFIYAYLTKPWDLRDLRASIARALDYFVLHRERDELLREKLDVLHRLLLLDRARCLAAMAAACGVNRPMAACQSYWQAALAAGVEDLAPNSSSSDIWTLAKHEAAAVVNGGESLRKLLRANPLDERQDVAIAQLVRDAGVASVDGDAQASLARGSVGSALTAILAGFNEPTAHIMETNGIEILLQGKLLPEQLFAALRADGIAAGIPAFAAWLCWYHHGGSIGLEVGNDRSQLNLRLIQNDNRSDGDIGSGWLDELMEQLV